MAEAAVMLDSATVRTSSFCCSFSYYVIEGEGNFAVGKRRATLGQGAVAWSTPRESHGVALVATGERRGVEFKGPRLRTNRHQ